jgi:hypothetical protein
VRPGRTLSLLVAKHVIDAKHVVVAQVFRRLEEVFDHRHIVADFGVREYATDFH